MREIVEPGPETWGQKGIRKMKQQPLVPLGILATTVALIGATRTFNSKTRDKATFNRWLRFRVIAQGLTVAACVAGSYVFGLEAKKQKALEEEARKQDDIERERARFQEAMAHAEEMQRIEDQAKQNQRVAAASTAPAQQNKSSWWPWK